MKQKFNIYIQYETYTLYKVVTCKKPEQTKLYKNFYMFLDHHFYSKKCGYFATTEKESETIIKLENHEFELLNLLIKWR